MNISRRKLALSASAIAAVGAVAALIAGVTFGLFTSSVSETNHFEAGTVTLTSVVTGACNIASPPTTDVKPGDSGTCTLATTYAGNPAYEALDVLIATKSGGGTGQTSALYNGTPTGAGLNVSISDGTTTYTVPTTTSTCPTGYGTGGWTCYGLNNELLLATGFAASSDTFTITWSLPSNTGNTYQGGFADIVLTAHAVQQRNNTISCSPTQAAGAPCTPGGTFSW